jgi:FkbM family methyltransferase
MHKVLQQISLVGARTPSLRRLAHVAFRIPGVGGMLRSTSEAVLPSEKRVWIQVHSGLAKGLWLKVVPKWEPGYLKGCAEEGMNEALSQYLKPGDCFYDVGAHIGFYSLIAARLVGEKGRVLAFEPDPDNAQVVEENACRNNFEQISCVRAAVSSQTGVVRFQRSLHDGPSRMSGMLIRDDIRATTESSVVSCPVVSLDSFCSSRPVPNLIKIDVEGAEIQVLMGARALLKLKKPLLVIEVHDPQDLPPVRSILSALDYSLYPIGARNFVAHIASSC